MFSRILLIGFALFLCLCLYTWLNKRSVNQAKEQFGLLAQELGLEMLEGEKKDKTYPKLKGKIDGLDFELYVDYSNDKTLHPDQTVLTFRLPHIGEDLTIMPVRPLQKKSIATGIAEFDELYTVYSGKESWVKAIFTPELAHDFVQLRHDKLFYGGKLKLKDGLLLYRRDYAAKFPKDKNQVLAIIEVVRTLAANILKEHKNKMGK